MQATAWVILALLLRAWLMGGYYHDYVENRELKNVAALRMVQRHLLIIPILKIMDNETALRALFSLYSVLFKKKNTHIC